ncbi:MAG: wax ester/triacylglycerol synthase domain-containing protein [Acidimicrobiales bacterium]
MGEQTELFMRDTDAFTWYMEHDPGLRSTILAIAWLDRRADFEVVAARLERATRLAPRFRQRLVEPPGHLATPRWVDTDFDLSFHLRRIAAPAPHTPETVIDFARVEAMSGFDQSRPLWQFTLVEGLEGDRAALVMKVHHSMTDGVGGMQLALLVFEATAEAGAVDEVPEPPADNRAPGLLRLIGDSLLYDCHRVLETTRQGIAGAVPAAARAARHPLRTTSDVVATVTSVGRMVQPVSDTLSPVMTGRGLDRHLAAMAVDLADLKRAVAAVGGTVNDGFVASVTGGLRRYHELHDAPVDELRITMPISMRREDDPVGGNRITLERFKVPVDEADPGIRVRMTGRECRAARREEALPLSNTIAGTLNLLPSGVVGSMLKHVDFLASNVPGVGIPIYLAGAPVSGYFAFGPTTGASLNVTLLSYAGTCCIGFTIDSAAVPDPDALMTCMAEGFEEVLALGGDHRPVVMPAGPGSAPAPPAG